MAVPLLLLSVLVPLLWLLVPCGPPSVGRPARSLLPAASGLVAARAAHLGQAVSHLEEGLLLLVLAPQQGHLDTKGAHTALRYR